LNVIPHGVSDKVRYCHDQVEILGRMARLSPFKGDRESFEKRSQDWLRQAEFLELQASQDL